MGTEDLSKLKIPVMEDGSETTAQLLEEVRLLRQQLAARAENDMQYAYLFEDMPISLWEEDLSGVKVVIAIVDMTAQISFFVNIFFISRYTP